MVELFCLVEQNPIHPLHRGTDGMPDNLTIKTKRRKRVVRVERVDKRNGTKRRGESGGLPYPPNWHHEFRAAGLEPASFAVQRVLERFAAQARYQSRSRS